MLGGSEEFKNGRANVLISVREYASYPTCGDEKGTYLNTLPSEAISVQPCKCVPMSIQGYACPGIPLSLAYGDWTLTWLFNFMFNFFVPLANMRGFVMLTVRSLSTSARLERNP